MRTLRQRVKTLRERSGVSEKVEANKEKSIRKRIERMSIVIANKISNSNDDGKISSLTSAVTFLNQAMQHLNSGDTRAANRLIISSRKLMNK